MENEREFLMSNARLKKYIKCLKHVSQEEVDGAGYDIISYRLNKIIGWRNITLRLRQLIYQKTHLSI